MANDLPTGSVTGRDGWEWNQIRDSEEDSNPVGSSQGRHSTRHQRSRERQPVREEIDVLRRENRHLHAELECKERQLQYVVDHYEHLLDEQCGDGGDRGFDEGPWDRVHAFAVQLIQNR